MILDRRRFLQAGAIAGVGAWVPRGRAEALRFAYVASGEDRVCVFASEGGGWGLAQTVSSLAPAGVAVSPNGRFVYVGNAVDRFEERPSGAVETFAVDARGRLTSAGRRGLALFATSPERLAVSPNGRWLAVGLAGAAYNLFPLGEDGLPGRVSASLRKIGVKGEAGPLVFAHDGLLLSFESERATALSVGEDGSLAFAARERGERASGLARRGLGEDARLMRAVRMAGVQARGAVALSQVRL